MSERVRPFALAAYDMGLCVVPPKEDGSKQPLVEYVEYEGQQKWTWKHWQEHRPDQEKVEGWYANGRTGLGYICGAISKNLELFEFDDGTVYDEFKLVAHASGLGELVDHIEAGYLERTPNGGIHWFYRCTQIEGNTELARRPKRPEEMQHATDKIKVLIETRGEGGYAVVAPSNGKVHPTGGAYHLIQGGPSTIATITPDERESLWELARTFDEMPRATFTEPSVKPKAKDTVLLRPGDDFNRRAQWEDTGLFDKGWVRVYEHGGTVYLRRPGKSKGVSATLNYRDSGFLYVFSTSTDFDAERGYSKFAVFTILNHAGDFKAAAKALGKHGYGEGFAAGENASPLDPDGKNVNFVNENIPYRVTESGIMWVRNTQSGKVEIPITNFQARIIGSILEDDGAEVSSSFEIEAILKGRMYRFPVSASSFVGMNWVPANMGPGAVVYPGMGTRDHARGAIQLLSHDFTERRVYKHTGWCRLENGNWAYLHAGGAILSCGGTASTAVDVRLPDSLSRMILPDPCGGQPLHDGIRAVLRLWDLGQDKLTIPVAATPFRAIFGDSDFTIWLAGSTGAFKTELAALGQQHFGVGFDARHLPASWSGTANSIEGLAFTAADMVLTVDDYAPQGTATDVQRLNALVDRVIRAQGNRSGRSRMGADGSLRSVRPPRGLIISTGEDVPPGNSKLGRMLVIDVRRGDITANRLSRCQADGRQGLYAQTMSNFLAWIAQDYEGHRARLRERVIALRDAALAEEVADRHSRTPEITANLAAALELFLRFGRESGVLSQAEYKALNERAWGALVAAEADQSGYQLQVNPARRFLSLLRTALTSGRCHMADVQGCAPENHAAYGWRPVQGALHSVTEVKPQGDLVGWVGAEDGGRREIWLLPDAALAAVKRLAQETHESFAVSRIALGKELHAQRLLITVATATARPTLTIRKTLGGRIQDVWHTSFEELDPMPGKVDKVDKVGSEYAEGPATGTKYVENATAILSTSGVVS